MSLDSKLNFVGTKHSALISKRLTSDTLLNSPYSFFNSSPLILSELSATNGVAGAMSERVPVVHIVGSPATSAQEKGALLHHTLGDGRYHVFESVGKSLAAASAILGEHAFQDCGAQIDRVLTIAVREVSFLIPKLTCQITFADHYLHYISTFSP